jgi:hypothetical protein
VLVLKTYYNMFAPIAVENLTLPDQALGEFTPFEGSQWNAAMSQLNTTTFQYSTSSVRIGSALSGGDYKYIGSTLASNGKIYCSPHLNSDVLVIDTNNYSVTQTGSVNNQNSGMLFDKVTQASYGFGNGGFKITLNNASTNLSTGNNRTSPGVQTNSANKVSTAAVAFITAGVYDYTINANSASFVTSVAGYRAGTAFSSTNNSVFYGNDSATNFLRYNPATNTATTFSSITAYGFSIITNYFDGFVYAFPTNGTTVIKRINPVTLEVVDVVTGLSSADRANTACIGADGRIYRLTLNNGNVRYYDPRTNAEGVLLTLSNGDVSYISMNMGVDGSLYFIPRQASYVHRIPPLRGSENVINIIKEFNFGGRYCWSS